METPKEYYYTYYSYEEWGKGYFGSRTCKCLPEEDIKYFGSFSDKTFKPTQKIILKDDYATREEAYADEIILQRFYKVVENPHFSNRAYQTSTKFYVPRERVVESNRKAGNKTKELGAGIHGQSKEKMTENGRKGGAISGKVSGRNHRENKTGIFGLTKKQRTENCKKGGKIISSQRWMCEETGYTANPGNLSKYQKARGIDTSKRKRIS